MIHSVAPVIPIPKFERSVVVVAIESNDERVPVSEGTGYRTVEGEKVKKECVIELDIDIPAIIKDLGRKAIRNKSGVSRDGYVIVRRVRHPRD